MSLRALLIDFGASRIKSAVSVLGSGELTHTQSLPSLPNISKTPRHFEADAAQLRKTFLGILDHYAANAETDFDHVFLTCEMHGFVACDSQGSPLTPYISWKDERGAIAPSSERGGKAGSSALEIFDKEWGPKFRQTTGMRLKPGLACVNLLHLGLEKKLKGAVHVLSLADWLAQSSGEPVACAHRSMTASLGFLDIAGDRLSLDMIGFLKRTAGIEAEMPEPCSDVKTVTHITVRGKAREIHAGLGDHPCALLGAGVEPLKHLSLNIGTGSQVSRLLPKIGAAEINSETFELRPFVDGAWLQSIPNIPAGRALSAYLVPFEEAAARGRGNADIWPWLSELQANDILASTMDVDLGLFKAAWNFKGGTGVSRLLEGEWTLKNFLASLLRSFAEQYVEAARRVDPKSETKEVILSGGIPQKLPALGEVWKQKLARTVRPARDIDETLHGLEQAAARALGVNS